MIAEIKFKNLYSFREETIFSFEAGKDKSMSDYHIVEILPNVRLLKLGIVYGANASGKSNFIKVCDFLKKFVVCVPKHKNIKIGVIPFLMDRTSMDESSELAITFYTELGKQMTKFVYSVSFMDTHIIEESLNYYPSQQPANIFERTIQNGISSIKFGHRIKLSSAAKDEISLKCLPNTSVFAAYMQVNINVLEIETALLYFNKQIKTPIRSKMLLSDIKREVLNDEQIMSYVLRYMQEADFNISDISSKEVAIIDNGGSTEITKYQHRIKGEDGVINFVDFPEQYESDGTIRTMELAAYIQKAIAANAFLAIDEIESSLHPKLIEYIIERFLKESIQAQLLFTTHYDGLLAEDDLLRKDNIWFTEKRENAVTDLYPLTDFKNLNRINSLQKAYQFGKFGAIPNI